jgi:ferric-dicitrate binding protein FerR (iron transport regulator)
VVVAGDVRVDGVSLKQVPEEKWFDVASEGPAVLRLADGSQAEIAAGSKAIIHAPDDGVRQAVGLDRGGGNFKVLPGPRQFRVETALGSVTVLGTEFSVKLDTKAKLDRKRSGNEKPSRGSEKPGRGRATLTVAVVEGSVKVECQGKSHVLTAPEQRVFPETSKKEDD